MSQSTILPFAEWLAGRCAFLHDLEAEAERVLHETKDTGAYKELMRQKALFLQSLPEEAEACAFTLPAAVAEHAMRRLNGFSDNASRALSIGSVFYMYALLYPDDHIKGQPNDFDLLVSEIRSLAASEVTA